MASSSSGANWWEPSIKLGCLIPTGLLVLGTATGRAVFYLLFGLSLFVGVPAFVAGLIGRVSHRRSPSEVAKVALCPTCGVAMAMGTSVCPTCSATGSTPRGTCQSCFAPLDLSVAFCPICGASTAEVTE